MSNRETPLHLPTITCVPHPLLQVRAASTDTLDTVAQLIPVFLQEIVSTFNLAVTSGEGRERQAELQGQLCGVLQVRRWLGHVTR